jgi:hypothetical protein
MRQNRMKISRNLRRIKENNNKQTNNRNRINKFSNLSKNFNNQMKNHKIHQFAITLLLKILIKGHLQVQKSSQKNHIQFYSTKMKLAHNLSCLRFLIDKVHIIFPWHRFNQVIPLNSHIKDTTMNKCHYQLCQM